MLHNNKLLGVIRTKLTDCRTWNTAKKGYRFASAAMLAAGTLLTPALGADALSAINNLSDFVFTIIRTVGLITVGWGVLQLGMSLQSHDASQRTQGILCVVAGIVIALVKEILTVLGI